MHEIHLIYDMMPVGITIIRYSRHKLTPSKRKTVESRQFGTSLVKTLASFVMNNISTLLSVFTVVNAIYTSPSDDMAVIMLIF